jgi:hypothetical protein
VKFGDDDLLSNFGDEHIAIIEPPHRPVRVGLIRPRVNFVPQLLKSVENL